MTTEPSGSAPPEPALEQKYCHDERADERELARTASFERRPDDEEEDHDEQERAGRGDEERARAQPPGSIARRPERRRLTQASGS